jgi:plastocyanin
VLRATGAGLAALGASGALAGCLSSGGGNETTAIEDWLADDDASAGVTDRTGMSETTVEVGVDDGLAFGPAAIRVDTGTTVVWEWTGRGGRHNVAANDGAFTSDYHREEGATFEHEFTDAGRYLYACTPHENLGMKGAVVVE